MTQHDGLKALINLQQVDSRIAELEARARHLPEELEELETRLRLNQEERERAQQSVEEQQKLRRQLEGEVAVLKEKLSRFKDQLMEVKTNREYQALLHEIDATEQEVAQKEDRILESMLAVDEETEKLQRIEAELSERDGEVVRQRQELEKLAQEAQDQIVILTEERQGLLSAISNDLRQLYNRISALRGVALAEARDQSCQVCHVRLRPQLFNEVRAGDRIITCENCNRILYFAAE